MVWPATTGTGAGLPGKPSDASLKRTALPATLQLATAVAAGQVEKDVATRPTMPSASAVMVPVMLTLVVPKATTRSLDSAVPPVELLAALSMIRHQLANFPPVPPWHGEGSPGTAVINSSHRPGTLRRASSADRF